VLSVFSVAKYDVLICGGGPAGAACAAFCAMRGLKTLVIEKCIFPREKVCGDCINPSCWPVLERLGVAGRILALPHSKLAELEFIGIGGRSVKFSLNDSARGEIAVKRSLFDHALLKRAAECGAEICEGLAVTAIERGWNVRAGGDVFSSRVLVAADGRNSSVTRALGLLPAATKERVAIQTHIPAPRDFGERVVLRFLPDGYCGFNSVGDGLLTLCLVGKPAKISALKKWAVENFAVPPDCEWQTITPIARKPAPASAENLFLIGDAARVVEPFTGEGIFYALASGELAAKHICEGLPRENYECEHAQLYAGRLCVNQLAKHAVLHPRIGSFVLGVMRCHPPALRYLTSKVVGSALQ
jgi:flavin-dependent dehydrogenase